MRTPGLVLAAVLLPAALHADGRTFTFNNYCSTGSLVSCASVSVTIIPRAGGGTYVMLGIQNLQGTNPFDNNPGSLITGIGISFPSYQGGDWYGTDDEDGMNYYGTPGRNVNTLFGTDPAGDHGAVFDGYWWPSGVMWNVYGAEGGTGIVGCDPPPSDTYDVVFQTCPRLGAPGAMVFSFEPPVENWPYGPEIPPPTAYNWAGEDFAVGWGGCGITANGKTGAVISSNCVQMTATPEPVTLILTGTGLAALGIVRRRRRLRT